MKTITQESEFKNNPIFSIIKTDDNGQPLERYSQMISFGLSKAKAILEHVEEIKAFVEKNESPI